MGGNCSLTAAGAFPDRFAAAASFHGGNLATDQPDSPHLFVKNITRACLCGGSDRGRGHSPRNRRSAWKGFDRRPEWSIRSRLIPAHVMALRFRSCRFFNITRSGATLGGFVQAFSGRFAIEVSMTFRWCATPIRPGLKPGRYKGTIPRQRSVARLAEKLTGRGRLGRPDGARREWPETRRP